METSFSAKPKRINTKLLGILLLERRVITPEQLERALAHQKVQGGLLGQVLITLSFVPKEKTEEELALALSAQYGFPYLPLDQYIIPEGVPHLIPESLARRECLIAIELVGSALSVAMADPLNRKVVEEVERLSGCTVQVFLSPPSAIWRAIEQHYATEHRASPPRINGNGNGGCAKATHTIRFKDRVLEILVSNHLLTPEQLEEAVTLQRETGVSLQQILVERGFVNESDLVSAMSQGLGIPLISLSRLKLDPALRTLIPRDVAKQYQLVPVARFGETLTVATADPLNVFALDTLRMITGLSITLSLATAKDIKETIDLYYGTGVKETLEEIVRGNGDSLELLEERTEELDASRLLQLVHAVPVVRLTDALLTKAVRLRASDLLIEPMEDRLGVRYRVDGVLQEGEAPAKHLHQAVVSRVKIMAELNIAEHRLPQDGHFRFQVEDRTIDFRVSVLPSSFGEKVALRVLDKHQVKLDLEGLGFAAEDLAKLKQCAARPHGMILATGPTGSGKTTTLYALLKHIHRPDKNLVTVEDPVEFELEGINQVAVRPDIGLTFARSLRAILRQDPDIIMVGEIRDEETADMAVKSALTGHLVLSTLHTTTASGSIVRLINMGVEPFLINSCLMAVIGQRLVRKICPHCRSDSRLPKGIAQRLGLLDAGGEPVTVSHGTGCAVCLNTGYLGREVIAEVLVMTPELRALILQRAQEREIEEAARRAGMRTLREHGLAKVLARVTSLEEVFRTTIGELVETG